MSALREVSLVHQGLCSGVTFSCVALTIMWYFGICVSPSLLLSVFTLSPESELHACLFNCCAPGLHV